MKMYPQLTIFLVIFTLFWAGSSLSTSLGAPPDAPESGLRLTQNWQFRQSGSSQWLPAEVPGCVHLDLIAAGRIGDPYYRDNEHQVQWVGQADWQYRTTFDVHPGMLSRQHIELCFDGLDTYADVRLNGRLVLSADNMFRKHVVDVAQLLREENNLLEVHFYSPEKRVQAAWDSLDSELAGGPKVLTRKAGYHYGWDWGPRLVTMGIWRPVYLRAWPEAIIRDVRVITDSVSAERAELRAVMEIESNTTQQAQMIIASLYDLEHPGWTQLTLQPGLNRHEIPFTVDSPKLWWTHNLIPANQPVSLYTIDAVLKIDNKSVSGKHTQFGIRTLELVTERDDDGESFYFKLNGVPVFMKGANYIPQDNFIPRVPREQYGRILDDARSVGMNMIRVWGGGVYEDDLFYEECDRLGILVWQDFMFACALYPGDPAFMENVRREAVDNVRRLRGHPCLALWCGNNEIDEAWFNWGWQKQYGYSPADSIRIRADYERLFHELLPGVVAAHDGVTPYWPSSPKYGRGDPRSQYEGDSHYWGVWHDAEPFDMFIRKTGRFMSEYGFQSFPPMETIRSFTTPEDRAVDSPVMLVHQKHPRGNQLIQTYMDRHYRTPRSFEQFVYVSQLLQAEGIKTAIEAHRRARPYCQGTLYWQLNDCWPVASWSSRDYFGRWKALHYFVKDAYSDILVSPTIEDSLLSVYVISDRLQPEVGSLELRLMNFFGEILWREELKREISPNTGEVWFETDLDGLLAGRDKRGLVLAARLRSGEELLSHNNLYFVPPKDLALPPADIQVEAGFYDPHKPRPPKIEGLIWVSRGEYLVTLESDVLAKNVFLSIDHSQGRFEKNFFDLLPGEPVRIQYIFTGSFCGTNDNFNQRVNVTSLADSFEPGH